MRSSATIGYGSTQEAAENRVVKIAGYLRLLTALLIISVITVLVVLGAWCILSPTATDDAELIKALGLTDNSREIRFDLLDNEFSATTKLLILSYCALMVAYGVYCLSRIYILFGNFKKSNIFIKHNSKLLRNLGYALLAGIVLGWLLNVAFLSGVGAIDATASLNFNFEFTIQFPPYEFLMKIVTIGLIFLSAWIIDIGRELYTANELTI